MGQCYYSMGRWSKGRWSMVDGRWAMGDVRGGCRDWESLAWVIPRTRYSGKIRGWLDGFSEEVRDSGR